MRSVLGGPIPTIWWVASLCLVLHSLTATDAADPIECSSQCKDYFVQREQLVKQDQQWAFDASMKLSQEEQKVDMILATLREQELDWFTDYKRIPSIYNFRTARALIDAKSRVLPLLWSMPKGGILHLHAMVDAQFLFQNGTYRAECYVNNGTGSDRAINGAFYYFATAPSNEPGEQWINVNAWRQSSGNVTAFDEALLNTFQFWTPSTDLESEDEMWVYFDTILRRMSSLNSYLPVFLAVRNQALAEYVQEGVQHVEMRGFGTLYDLEGNSYDEINATLQLLHEWNALNPLRPFTMRWIYSVLRRDNTSTIFGDLLDAVHQRRDAHRRTYVVGFDLVDEEDRFHTLLYYLNDFLRISDYIQAHNDTPLPYFFHAGETVFDRWGGENLYDAVLLNTTRIGHGFALKDYPALMEQVISRNIAVEVCPISNQMLELVEDMRDHPAVTMMNFGIPVVLSSDDPVAYGYVGPTYDWYMAYISWNLTLSELKQLALNSIQYSALDDTVKRHSLVHWHRMWEQWIDIVLIWGQTNTG